MAKNYFAEEITKTVKSISEYAHDIAFVLVSDTHISDTGSETCENICEVDSVADFDFMVHTGDFLTGQIPEKISRKILKEEINMYRSAIRSKKLFITQGNHDGYRNESFKGQLVDNIVFDSVWHEDTKFIDDYGVIRENNKPYYYYDMLDKKCRFIFLNGHYYTFNEKEKQYIKHYGFVKEVAWLTQTLETTPKNYTVFVFSHGDPLNQNEYFNDGGKEAFEAVAFAKNMGLKIAGWFYGHEHWDAISCVHGINMCAIASQTPYIPQLWTAPDGATFHESRELQTLNQDLWDSVLVNLEKREIKMIRFGAGEDRLLNY